MLTRRLGQDSSTSSRPPSSDNPYRKGRVKSSARGRSGKRPGKQPGAPGTTLRLAAQPDETLSCVPEWCECGQDLTGVPARVERRQVVERATPPPPVVTEYRVHHVRCPSCGVLVSGKTPVWATGRVQYGPGVLGAAAEITCAQYVPVARGAQLLGALTGVGVSCGFMAGVRAKAAGLVKELFMPVALRVLRDARVIHVDETPARAAGQLAYVHVKTTDQVAVFHTGDRSAATIDADGVLEHFSGIIVRDGYAGYEHLIAAVHAWCNAHLLRDLHAIAKTDPAQLWAIAMRDTLLEAHNLTITAGGQGLGELPADQLERIDRLYTGAFSLGLRANEHRSTQLAKDAYRLAKRFRDHKDMILRFALDLDVPFTNNIAERDLRPVKIQQRTSGGTWRTLHGLADFALVRSYLATATKNAINTLDALTRLFKHQPYLPAPT